MDADGEAVLQFLLGKTSAIPLEDTRSVTSTSSSQAASDATSAGSSKHEDDETRGADELTEEADELKIDEVHDGSRQLTLQPICEDDSEAERQQQQEEEEEEEDAGTDRESTDDEHEDDAQTFEPPVMTAGTESEVEDEDKCGSTIEQEALAVVDDSPAVLDPPLHDDKAVKTSDTRAASTPNCEEQVDDEAVHTLPHESASSTPTKPGEEPSRNELALVSVVVVALLAYVAAILFSFLYRDVSSVIVLPDATQFEHPTDMSNVSVHIVSPLNHSAVSAPLLRLDWQLARLPADALRAGGPEVFKYEVLVNDKRVKSEIALLELTPSEEEDKATKELNRSMTQYIRWDALDASTETFTVRIDVKMTVPGSLDQFTMLSQSLVLVNGQKTLAASSEDDVSVKIKTPMDDELLTKDDDLVLAYSVGAGVERLRVDVDGELVAWKTHVSDGVLLLHGLAEGSHEVSLTAFGQSDSEVASSSSVRVHFGAS